jgi:hypothetical protein
MIRPAQSAMSMPCSAGINAGLLYFHIDDPDAGNVFYFQNLTALNDYCRGPGPRRKTASVGSGPISAFSSRHPLARGKGRKPLAAGVEVTLSDATILFRPDGPRDERDRARHFLQMLGGAYQLLDLPDTEYRDWIERVRRRRCATSIGARGDDPPLWASVYPSLHRGRISRHHGTDVARPGDPRMGPMDGRSRIRSRPNSRPDFRASTTRTWRRSGAIFPMSARRQGRRRGRQLVSLSPAAQPREARARRRRRGGALPEIARLRRSFAPRIISTINGRSSTRSPISR